jgi:sugar lactone lactonase YvrE
MKTYRGSASRLGSSPFSWLGPVLVAGVVGLSFVPGFAGPSTKALAPVDLVAKGFRDARGVVVDAEDNVFVADHAAGTVTRIGRDAQTGLVTRSLFATSLREPVGLALDASGRLLVAEGQAGRVLRFEADGSRTVVATRLDQPRWLAIDERGTIYVSASGIKRPSGARHRDYDDDDDNDTIVAVSATGVMSVFMDGFENVEGLAVSDGALYAAGRGLRYKGHKVHARDADGVVYRIPILAGGRAGVPKPYGASDRLQRPRGLTVDHVGALYATAKELRLDRRDAAHVVAKIQADGTVTPFAWNLDQRPQGLAFDGDGNLYVTDGRSGHVFRFRAPSAPVLTAPRFTKQPVITLRGTTEVETAIDAYLNGNALPVPNQPDRFGRFSLQATLTSNAENLLHVFVTGADGKGLTSAVSESVVTHDTVAPSLVFTAPAQGATIREPVTVTVQATDGGSQVMTVALRVGSSPLAATVSPTLPAGYATASAVWDASSLADGAHTLVAVATDQAGNSTTVSRAVVVENQRVPTLTVSPSTVVAGGEVTVTLTGGLGGDWDWLAFAETTALNTSFAQWTYVGAGVRTRTWTVIAPTTPGSYEFRLFLNDGFTRAATSPAVTVLPGALGITSLVPSRTMAGGPAFTLTVNGSSFGATSVVRWNGAGLSTTFVSSSQLQAAVPASLIATPGTAQVTVFTPGAGGGTSGALTFTIAGPPALTVSASSVQVGGSVTVTLIDGLGGNLDWLAFADAAAADTNYLQWTYVGAGVDTTTWTVTVPTTPGTYQFRLFLNDGFVRAATSPTVTVTP